MVHTVCNKQTRRRYWPAFHRHFYYFLIFYTLNGLKRFGEPTQSSFRETIQPSRLLRAEQFYFFTLYVDDLLFTVSVSPRRQSLGEGGRLHVQGEPLETEASGLHPRPAGAHRLLQPEASGGTDKKTSCNPNNLYNNNPQIKGILCHISTISRLQLLQRGLPSCTVTLQPSTPSWVSGESGIVWWSGCLGWSGRPIGSDLMCHSGTRCAWPGHTLKTDPLCTSMVNQWTSWQVGSTTGLQVSELWRATQGSFSCSAVLLVWTLTSSPPAHTVGSHPSVSLLGFKLAPNGTLTLGAAHILANGNIQVISITSMLGKVSLFRLWGRERSEQEVTSLDCTEGDLVRWSKDHWDTLSRAPVTDPSLQCGELQTNLYFNWCVFTEGNTSIWCCYRHMRLWIILPWF